MLFLDRATICCAFLLLCFSAGCRPLFEFRAREPTLSDPIILSPMISKLDEQQGAGLSERLSEAIYQNLVTHGRLSGIGRIKKGVNFSIEQLELLKRNHPLSDFMVCTELIEYKYKEEPLPQLLLSVSLHLIDLRSPALILQEVIQKSCPIASPSTLTATSGDKNYEISPLGIAHGQICREIARRIEEYILISKKAAPTNPMS